MSSHDTMHEYVMLASVLREATLLPKTVILSFVRVGYDKSKLTKFGWHSTGTKLRKLSP